MTVPSADAQKQMLRNAYRRAGVSPAQVQYVEAHGTGTPVGDPIEANAIGEVLGQASGRRAPCLIGSAKTNVGHLEAASGVVGLIKTALALHHRQIPASLHFHTPNPKIAFDTLGLRVASELRAMARKRWTRNSRREWVWLRRQQCAHRLVGSTGQRDRHQ